MFFICLRFWAIRLTTTNESVALLSLWPAVSAITATMSGPDSTGKTRLVFAVPPAAAARTGAFPFPQIRWSCVVACLRVGTENN